jgi:hypothetical protein
MGDPYELGASAIGVVGTLAGAALAFKAIDTTLKSTGLTKQSKRSRARSRHRK